MAWIARIGLRLRALLRRDRVEGELDEELRFHLERQTELLVRQGVPPDEARRRALRDFGGVERFKEECRDARGVRPLEELAQDTRYAVRSLRANPGFAAVVVLTLALGIGATTAIFSAVNGVLLEPLPYEHADRILMLSERDASTGAAPLEISPGNFLDLRERAQTFATLAAAEPYALDYRTPEGPESIRTWLVTEGFFEVLGARAMLGRTLLPEEFVAGREPAVVLGNGLWRRRFGADSSIVGRTITLDEGEAVVVGVMPPSFGFPPDKELWAPKIFDDGDRRNRSSAYYVAIGRLAPDVTREAAQAELDAIARRLGVEHPRTNADLSFVGVPLPDAVLGGARPGLLLLLGAVALVLLIACANVANLVLARVISRGHEMALRVALGAGRGRLVRQLLTESVVLGLLGGAAGVALAYWGAGAIRALSPSSLPRADEIGVDARVLGFALGISLLTALLVALVPALRLVRGGPGALVGGRRGTAGRGQRMAGKALVVSEVGLAVVLLVGAGLLTRSFVSVLNVDRGFRAEHVVGMSMYVWQWYRQPGERVAFFEQLVERAEALPGVSAAAITSSLPLAEPTGADQAYFSIEGRAALSESEEPTAHTSIVSPGYFRTMGIALRRGRTFGATDDARHPSVAVISETMARRHWPGEDPIGRRVVLRFGGRREAHEIIGVVSDVRHTGLDETPRPSVYIPHAQSPVGGMTLVARGTGSADALVPAIKRTLWSLNPAVPPYTISTLEGLLDDSLRARRFDMLLLLSFAATALALAAVGVYGLVSHATTERTREIGVRVALGAQAGAVQAMIVRQGVAPALLGVVLGLAGAALLTRVLRGMLFGVTPLDPATYGAVSALLLLIAAVACLAPARRATRVDPAVVLRAE